MQENPFADLIPQQNTAQAENPFADLIPKNNARPQSTLDKLANSAPINALLGAGDSISNLMRGSADLIPGVNIPLAKTGEGTAYNVGKIAGDVAGFMGGGEALDTARAAAEGAPLVGKLAQALAGGGLSGAGRRALGSGLYGAIENPDDKTKGAGEMAALSTALDAVFGGAAKLLPSNVLKGNLSNEELLKNFEAARGTNTPIGDVVGSPGAKQWYENLVAKVPGSGSDVTGANIANQIKSQGQDIFNQLAQGADTNDLKSSIKDALNKSYDDAMKLKRQHYKDLDDLASSHDLKIDTSNFENTAKEILDTVKESPRLMEEMDSSLLKKLQNYANPYEAEKIKSTNVFKGLLGDKARTAFREGKDYEGGIYRNLKNALEQDVNGAFESTGDPELQSKYQEAQNFYRTNIAPYEEPEIEKFVRKGGDSDMILSTFLKRGQNDRANLLGKLMDKLPEDGKNLVPAAYLSGALKDGELDPLKMRTLYNALGNKQKQTLLSPDMKQKMDNFARLVNMNTTSLSRMANPNTGQKTIPLLISALGGSLGAGGGSLAAGPVGAMIGTAAAPLTSVLLARGLNKYATSPATREKLVKALVEGSPTAARLKQVSQILKPVLGYPLTQ